MKRPEELVWAEALPGGLFAATERASYVVGISDPVYTTSAQVAWDPEIKKIFVGLSLAGAKHAAQEHYEELIKTEAARERRKAWEAYMADNDPPP